MDYRKFLVVFVVFLAFFSSNAQNKYDKWALGVGASVSAFPQNGNKIFGMDYIYQMPGVSLTRYIKNGFSFGGELYASGGKEIKGLYENKYEVMSFGFFGRYNLKNSKENFDHYVLVGTSILVKDLLSKVASLNVGTGVNYWFTPRIGLNSQLSYRYLPSIDDTSFGSHINFSLGLVVAIGEKNGLKKRGGSGFCNY